MYGARHSLAIVLAVAPAAVPLSDSALGLVAMHQDVANHLAWRLDKSEAVRVLPNFGYREECVEARESVLPGA